MIADLSPRYVLLVFLMSRARVGLGLDVPCPYCRAPRGYPCRTARGAYRPRVHAGRSYLK